MKILVSGGTGYIGSHTAVELLEKGYEVVAVDNFSNSSPEVLNRIKTITGKEVIFYEGDIRDRDLLEKVFSEQRIDCVIHFAGLKAVGESCAKPLEYYDNNLYGTLVLLETMRKHGCKKIIFSSSATVYGDPERLPLDETCKTGGTTNPYGTSKYFQEIIMSDLYKADNEWTVVLLRYFNPVGAHPSAEIGELPNGVPQNLVPFLTQAAMGIRKELSVFGNDYNTPDGSCIRDYIDVVDLAKAHVIAVERMLEDKSDEKVEIFNLGTGNGMSVLGLINAFERATGVKVPHKIAPRRAGDIEKVWANPERANNVLGWVASTPIEETLRNAWTWQCKLRERGVM